MPGEGPSLWLGAACKAAHPALEHGAVDRHLRRALEPVGRGAEGVRPRARRDPRRRDPGQAAGAGQGQDCQGVCVGVPHDELRGPAGGLLRLQHRTRRRQRTPGSAGLRRHLGVRRLLGLSRVAGSGRDGRAVHGACAQETVRGAPVQRQPDRCSGAEADRQALRDRARGARTPTRGQAAVAPAARQTGGRGLADLAERTAPEAGQGRCQGLGGAHGRSLRGGRLTR